MSWFDKFYQSCHKISTIDLKCFENKIIKTDTANPVQVYGTNVTANAFFSRVSVLSDSEKKHRLSTWLKHTPTTITDNILFAPFQGYVLFEFKEQELFVFESLMPNNAFYCFKAPNIEQLMSRLNGKTKTQLCRDNQVFKRGYHMSGINFDIYVASLF